MAQQQTARLQSYYREKIVPDLVAKFGYKSTMQVPRLQKIVSDAVGVGLGNAVLGVGRTAAGMVRGAVNTARSAESAPGAILGLTTGAIGGGVAASAAPSAQTLGEAVGAFREGADARIQAMREPSETPVNSGEAAASNQPEDKA